MYRDESEIRRQLSLFFESVVAVAKEDEVITSDEKKILDTIEAGIHELEDQLINVLKSELHDEEFNDLQTQILQDIVYNATKVAEEDDVITPEESALIEKLKEFAKDGVF